MTIPVITTERLTLRPQTMVDWPAFRALMMSKRAEFMGGPMAEQKAWGTFCHGLALWPLMGHGALMVNRREDGQCLGQVVINHGPLFAEKEIGWYVYPDAEGFGYAFEAANALLDWAFNSRGLKTLVSYIEPENTRSIRLAEGLGAQLDADAPRLDPLDLVYRHFPQ